jgi:hypothetical protein
MTPTQRIFAIALMILALNGPAATAASPTPLWHVYPLGSAPLRTSGAPARAGSHRRPDANVAKHVGGSHPPVWIWATVVLSVLALGLAAVSRGWTTSSSDPDLGVRRADPTKLAFVCIAAAVAIATGFLIPLLS